MSKEQIVGLAVRLFAIFLALYTLRYASSLLAVAGGPPPVDISVPFIAFLALFPILAAVLLWMFPLTIAAKLIPEIGAKIPPKPMDAGSLEIVAFSVMGLWVLATAIPDLFYWIAFQYKLNSLEAARRPALSAEHVGHMTATVVELIIGLWLLLGSKGILSLIRKARYAGS